MIVQDRDTSRKVFLDAWSSYRNGVPVSGIEQLVLAVILQHPEYHHWFNQPDILQYDFDSRGNEENPFLHMGLHIAILEQISTDRPPGTVSCYQDLRVRYTDEHDLHHRMMECLGNSLWQAQQDGRMPDEVAYLECLRKLA